MYKSDGSVLRKPDLPPPPYNPPFKSPSVPLLPPSAGVAFPKPEADVAPEPPDPFEPCPNIPVPPPEDALPG